MLAATFPATYLIWSYVAYCEAEQFLVLGFTLLLASVVWRGIVQDDGIVSCNDAKVVAACSAGLSGRK